MRWSQNAIDHAVGMAAERGCELEKFLALSGPPLVIRVTIVSHCASAAATQLPKDPVWIYNLLHMQSKGLSLSVEFGGRS